MFFSRHSFESTIAILEGRFPYYLHLDEREKNRFVNRLLRFLHDKVFEGRQELTVTVEMEVLISATAIQLTFGLKEYILPFFDRIIIYPHTYYSTLGKAYHKGETNSQGAVILSWADFEEGLADPHDKLNLGLHEWAHALMLENQYGSGWDELFREYYNRWRFEAQPEFEELELHYNDVFRSYGGTNIAEFFAVSVEVFFEAPEEFRKRAPSLFHHFCVLLNQYPLGKPAEAPVEALSMPAYGQPELQLKAEQTDSSRFVINLVAFILVSLFINMNLDLPAGWFVVLLLLAGYSFYYWWNEMGQKKTISFYSNHLEVLNRKGKLLASYDFDNLAGLEISASGLKYDITFIFPEKGEVFDEEFRFSFEDEQIEALRKALRAKNLPTKFYGYKSNYRAA